LNRVDDIIVFGLSAKSIGKDYRDAPGRCAALARRSQDLDRTHRCAKELLFTQGYDANFGARPAEACDSKLVQDPLALKILDGTFCTVTTSLSTPTRKPAKMKFEVSQRMERKNRRSRSSKTNGADRHGILTVILFKKIP